MILQAQDYGAGSSGSGVWGPSVSFTLPQSGSITVPLRWQTGSATLVKIASTTGVPVTPVATDWGVNSGATQTLSGKAVSADNTDSITFSTSGRRFLILSYKLGGSPTTQTVTINVNPYVPPTNLCTQPAHTIAPACGSTTAGPASVTDLCPTTGSVPDCQYQCAPGYKVKNGICAKSSIQEI